jgi:group I intron endonuclease
MNKQDFILKTLNIAWYNIDESGKVLQFDANTPGVYVYRNTLELDKVYIGSTATLSKRAARHQSEVAQGKVSCPRFYNAVRKYGWSQYQFGVLEYVSNTSDLIMREQYFLDLILPYYNVNKLAGSMRGFKHSVEFSEKIRTARLGKKHSADTKEKISRSLLKKQSSNNSLDDHIRCHSQPDEDTLSKMSKAIVASHTKPKRSSLSKEHRLKLSKAMLGNKLAVGKRAPLSEEHKAKIRDAMIGRKRAPLSEEHKAKIRETLIGKKGK